MKVCFREAGDVCSREAFFAYRRFVLGRREQTLRIEYLFDVISVMSRS